MCGNETERDREGMDNIDVANFMRRCAIELVGVRGAALYPNDLDTLLDKGTAGEVAAKLLHFAGKLSPR